MIPRRLALCLALACACPARAAAGKASPAKTSRPAPFRLAAAAMPVEGAPAPAAPAALSAIDAAGVVSEVRAAAAAARDAGAVAAPDELAADQAGSGVREAAAEAPPLEAGPRTAAPASRMRRVLAGAAGLLGRRGGGDVPAGDGGGRRGGRLSGGGGKRGGGPGRDGEEPASPDMSGLVRAGVSTQAGYEMLSSGSLPIFLQQAFGSMRWMADLAIVGTLASIAGRALSPLLINRFRIKSIYLALMVATFVVAAAIGGLAYFGGMTIPVLFGLMTAYRLLQAAASNAEETVIPTVYGTDSSGMNQLRGRKHQLLEFASVLVQNGAPLLVVLFASAAPNLVLAGLLYVAAIFFIAFQLRIPASREETRLAPSRAGPRKGFWAELGSTLAAFGRDVGSGASLVLKNPLLRVSTALTALDLAFNMITYSLLAPLFAESAVGTGDLGMTSLVMGLIAGMFSLGGLYAGRIAADQSRLVEEKHGKGAEAAEEERRSAVRWFKRAAWSFLLVGAMALPLPALPALVGPGAIAAFLTGLLPWTVAPAVPLAVILIATAAVALRWPRTGLALALLAALTLFPLKVGLAAGAFMAFGLLQVVAAIKNDSFFDAAVQQAAPAAAGSARAFVRIAAALAGLAALVAVQLVFHGVLPFGIAPPSLAAFPWLVSGWAWLTALLGPFGIVFVLGAVPTALLFHLWSRRFDALTRPAAPGA